MSTFAWGLLAAIALLLLLQIAGRSRFAVPAWCAACFVAPLLFACMLQGSRPASVEDGQDRGGAVIDYQHSGSLFIAFHGVRQPLTGDFRIGGSDNSDFLLDRLPDSGDVAAIDGKGVLQVSTVTTQNEHYSAIQGSLKDLSRHGALPTWALLPGSKICFAKLGTKSCEDESDWTWTVSSDSGLGVSRRTSPQVPAVEACNLGRFVTNFRWQARLGRVPTAQERIFPLAIYGRPKCASEIVETDGDSALDRTFLHFDERGYLFVSQLPSSDGKILVVEHARRIVSPSNPASPSGAGFDVTVFRMQVSSPLPQVESRRRLWIDSYSAESGRSRLVRVSSLEVRFQVSNTSRTAPDLLQVTTTRPAVVEVPPSVTCRQTAIVNLMGIRERSRSAPEESKTTEATARVPFLADLGRMGSSGALLEVRRANVDVPSWRAHGCRSFSRADLTLIGATGAIEHVRGSDLLALGAPSGAVLLLSAAEYGVPGPWILGLLLLASVLRCTLRATVWQTVVQAPIVGAVLVIVDTLLVIRLVIAMQEIAAQPHIESAVVSALLVILLLPLILELLIFGVNRISVRGSKLLSTVRRRFRMDPQRSNYVQKMATWAVPAVLLLIPLLHLSLVLAGFREQIGGIRITALFVPAYVILLATLVAFGGTFAPMTWPERHPALLLFGGSAVALLAFVLARDVGAVITITGAFIALSLMVSISSHIPGHKLSRLSTALLFLLIASLATVLSGGLLLYTGRGGIAGISLLLQHPALASLSLLVLALGCVAVLRWRTAPGWKFAAPGLLAALVLFTLSSARFDRSAVDCSVGDVVEVATCLETQSLDTNRLRLAYLIYPALSRLNVTGEARGMNAVFDELHWLTTEFPGEGLMNVPPRKGLDQHDNAIATHIIGPQGRASAWLLCTLLGLPLLFMVGGRRSRRFGLRRPLPWLAYGCFAFTSIYMILGNLLMVPFTGRNVYLTNAFSGTDVLEGGLLLALVLVPLAALKGTHAHGASND